MDKQFWTGKWLEKKMYYIYIYKLNWGWSYWSVLRKMRHETGWGDARHPHPPTGNRSQFPPSAIGQPVSGRRWVVLSWPSARVSAIELKVEGPCAPQGWHIPSPSMCVWCVCFNVKSFWPILLFLRSQKKKQQFWHITIMFTKLRSVLEWCFLSTSTVNETFFRRGNKSARRVRNEKGAFSISNFRRSISAISCSLSLSAYRGYPFSRKKTGKFICWLLRSVGPAGWKRNPQVHWLFSHFFGRE